MLNIHQHHDFAYKDAEDIGGYTLALVECSRCGERRKIGCTTAEANVTGGCKRRGSSCILRAGDLVVRDRQYLDQFIKHLPGGMVLTYNAGGSYHRALSRDIVPATPRRQWQ